MAKIRYTEDECILALELYLTIPKKEIRVDNPKIISLSDFLASCGHPHGANSVKMKLENFKANDPLYPGIGLTKYTEMDKRIWDEYSSNGFIDIYDAAEEARKRLSSGKKVARDHTCSSEGGITRTSEVKQRANQDMFRGRVLTVYDSTCCITGIQSTDLIQACHIKPWGICAEGSRERLDPRNGLCLNVLHHKAFDKGFFTLDEKYRVELSPVLDKIEKPDVIERYYRPYEGKRITIDVEEYLPSEIYLDYHRKNIFIEKAES